MRCTVAGPLPTDARTLMRHFGYTEHVTDGMGLTFIRKAHEAAFPRFHAMVHELMEGGFAINMHLDQANLGEGNHKYVWAYKNPNLDEEAKRILGAVDKLKYRLSRGEYVPLEEPTPSKPEKMGLIAKLFRIM